MECSLGFIGDNLVRDPLFHSACAGISADPS